MNAGQAQIGADALFRFFRDVETKEQLAVAVRGKFVDHLPDERGHGHGSRLLQACADTLIADRFSRATTWVFATDDTLRTFLTSAGWAPDGAHRELATDGPADDPEVVNQVRLHTSLS